MTGTADDASGADSVSGSSHPESSRPESSRKGPRGTDRRRLLIVAAAVVIVCGVWPALSRDGSPEPGEPVVHDGRVQTAVGSGISNGSPAGASAGAQPVGAERADAARGGDSLSGYVVDESGNGIPLAVVVPGPAGLPPAFESDHAALYYFEQIVDEARRAGPSVCGADYATTAADGRFAFSRDEVLDKKKLLVAHRDRGARVLVLAQLPAGESRIVLPRRPRVHGLVRAAAGQPVPRAGVQLYRRGRLMLTVTADATGSFASPPLPPGEYLVTTAPPNQAPPVAVIVREDGPREDTFAELVLPPDRPGVRLVDSSGSHLTGESLEAATGVTARAIEFVWSEDEPRLAARATPTALEFDPATGLVALDRRMICGHIGIWRGYELLGAAACSASDHEAEVVWRDGEESAVMSVRIHRAELRLREEGPRDWRVALGVVDRVGNRYVPVVEASASSPGHDELPLSVPGYLFATDLLMQISHGDVEIWRCVETPSGRDDFRRVDVALPETADVTVSIRGGDSAWVAPIDKSGELLSRPGTPKRAKNGRCSLAATVIGEGARIVAWSEREDGVFFGSVGLQNVVRSGSVRAELTLRRGRRIDVVMRSDARRGPPLRLSALGVDGVLFDERLGTVVHLGRVRSVWVPAETVRIQARDHAGAVVGEAGLGADGDRVVVGG